MDDLNEAAPHSCPACGYAAYIGFSEVKCTNKACPHYNLDLWVEWAMLTDDTGDPPDTLPRSVPDLFRDFCTHCHVPQYFPRYEDGNGVYHAYCKQCGKPNHWTASLFEDEDTQPQSFKSDLGAWLDDPVSSD